MEIASGVIKEIYSDGRVLIQGTLPNLDKAIDHDYEEVVIGYPDGRGITPEQRKKAYALMGEIAEYIGDYAESVKAQMKMEFLLTRLQGVQRRMFSLADVDRTTAKEFITFLVDFIIEHGIPTKVSLLDNCEDTGRMIYASAMHKRCAVCGLEADIHHIDRVGMGNDRKDISHLGRRFLPLCRKHHTICHNDEKSFLADNHLVPIRIDEAICRKYKLKK